MTQRNHQRTTERRNEYFAPVTGIGAIDCWLNPNPPETARQPEVMFATDWPLLPFERCIREVAALPFRDGVLQRYLYENAAALFPWPN